MTLPYLLYVYPWMPYPRRVLIYLRERDIPSSLVTVVRCSDPGPGGSVAPPEYPPKPPGSLPILCIPANNDDNDDNNTKADNGDETSSGGAFPPHSATAYTYISQSTAILIYLETLCANQLHGFPALAPPTRNSSGDDDDDDDPTTAALTHARDVELLTLAEELTVSWNPVRTFGTGAGTMRVPAAAKEMLRWTRRALMSVESLFERDGRGENFAESRRQQQQQQVEGGHAASTVTIGEIVLFQFLEFTEDCYGVDMTMGSGETVRDVYGRDVQEEFPRLRMFYRAFRTRKSARRDEMLNEAPSAAPLKAMTDWSAGIL